MQRWLTERAMSTRLIMQVHDELVFEVPTGEVDALRELVDREMTTAVRLDVPLVVDIGIGSNWLDCKA